jgi:hypothetical protein
MHAPIASRDLLECLIQQTNPAIAIQAITMTLMLIVRNVITHATHAHSAETTVFPAQKIVTGYSLQISITNASV